MGGGQGKAKLKRKKERPLPKRKGPFSFPEKQQVDLHKRTSGLTSDQGKGMKILDRVKEILEQLTAPR